MIRIRPGYRRAAVAVGAALILTAAPVGTPPAYADNQVDTFTVSVNYGLYKSSGGTPVLVHSERFAPPGAGIATIESVPGNVTAFAIGLDGGLVLSRTVPLGAGPALTRDGPPGLAPPGAPITAAGLDVFFVGRNGAVFHRSYRSGAPVGPRQVTVAGLAPPGAVVATIPGITSGVAFVGTDGALRVVRPTSTGTWTATPASPPNVATPGGGLTAVSATAGFVTGLDGRIWQVRLTGGPLPDPWATVPVAGVGAAPAGAHLTAAQFAGGPTIVMFAGHDGAVRATSNVTGTWHEPTAATAAGVAVAGKPIATTIHGDHLHGDWCGNSLAWQIRIPKPIPQGGPYPEPWNAVTYSFQAPAIQPGGHVTSVLR
ncbi:hypothetical protein AWW66_22475 [Micromonospora rosaria]|uniref:Uncharacterized protein n=1 Tax=Micromonospora rosaria TaxID=47874 RepID=A0A136PMQ2_9ACTN|nr:hypothetical protein [Micromonospora rosaria]KXK59750.1 hypothetical protein AWW66_22475 [Micromonospora rosaria]